MSSTGRSKRQRQSQGQAKEQEQLIELNTPFSSTSKEEILADPSPLTAMQQFGSERDAYFIDALDQSTWANKKLVNTSLIVNLRDNLQKQRVEAERAVRWRDQRIASLSASLSKEKELRAQSLRVQRSAETLLNSLKEHLA
ncbi:hypothetical protein GE061_013631 [Apolygus lucorum]|uniref:Uncharacterized protein n=1 Tax=Apolygus lucorum TaxID=248454 RepID=A0A8S9XSE3_APOLU|nr:hypothetical protein GE061_013631 [Apolygus lucorum]